MIAGDRETGEEYLGEVLDDSEHGHSPKPRPIVRVLRAVRYPDQRCIAHPDIALELPPIPAGTACRLEILRPAGADELRLMDISPGDAVSRAITRAMDSAQSGAEREILARHAAGEHGRRRVMITFSDADLDFLRICEQNFSKRMTKNELPENLDKLPGGH